MSENTTEAPTMEETQKVEETHEEMTPEQIAEYEAKMKAHKKELLKFYKEEIPLLKAQAEYEEYHTRIEVAKMTRLEIMLAKARMSQPPQPQPEMPDTGEHTKPEKITGGRTLKKEE